MELIFTVFAVVGLIAFANVAVGIGVKFRAWLDRVVGQRIKGRCNSTRPMRGGFVSDHLASCEDSSSNSTTHTFSRDFASSETEFSFAGKLRALLIGALLISMLFTVFASVVAAGIALIPGVESHHSVQKFFGMWVTLFVVFALLIYISARQNGRW